jgi:hypothetical protein
MFFDDPVITAWTRYRTGLILACLAASSCEIFFFLNFRWYAPADSPFSQAPRDGFLRIIEQDFRSFALRRDEVRS